MRQPASDDSVDGRSAQEADAHGGGSHGYPSLAGISPVDVADLRGFLAEHDDASAYEVTHRRPGDGVPTTVVAEMAFVDRTLERPSAAVVLECEPLPPAAEPWRVRFDELDRVSVVEPPASVFEPRDHTQAERISGFVGLARFAPERVPVSELVVALEDDDPAVRETALQALDTLADVRAEDCVAALPTLRELLGAPRHATDALEVVATVADERPRDVAPLAEDVATHLTGDDAAQRGVAARCLSSVADHDAADVADAVPALETLVADRGDGWPYAVHVLNRVAAEHPEQVRPAVPTLTEIVGDESASTNVLLNATGALGRVCSEYPEAGLDGLEAALALLTADDHRIRANAAGVLSDIALGPVGALVPHVDALTPLLGADDEYLLTNATAALSRVAEVEPGAVAHLTDRFVDLLASDHELVRVNACWTLGYLAAESATDALEDRRLHDDSEQVRDRAAWALVEIGTEEGSTAGSDRSDRG